MKSQITGLLTVIIVTVIASVLILMADKSNADHHDKRVDPAELAEETAPANAESRQNSDAPVGAVNSQQTMDASNNTQVQASDASAPVAAESPEKQVITAPLPPPGPFVSTPRVDGNGKVAEVVVPVAPEAPTLKPQPVEPAAPTIRPKPETPAAPVSAPEPMSPRRPSLTSIPDNVAPVAPRDDEIKKVDEKPEMASKKAVSTETIEADESTVEQSTFDQVKPVVETVQQDLNTVKNSTAFESQQTEKSSALQTEVSADLKAAKPDVEEVEKKVKEISDETSLSGAQAQGAQVKEEITEVPGPSPIPQQPVAVQSAPGASQTQADTQTAMPPAPHGFTPPEFTRQMPPMPVPTFKAPQFNVKPPVQAMPNFVPPAPRPFNRQKPEMGYQMPSMPHQNWQMPGRSEGNNMAPQNRGMQVPPAFQRGRGFGLGDNNQMRKDSRAMMQGTAPSYMPPSAPNQGYAQPPRFNGFNMPKPPMPPAGQFGRPYSGMQPSVGQGAMPPQGRMMPQMPPMPDFRQMPPQQGFDFPMSLYGQPQPAARPQGGM